ncbi:MULTISPECIES: tautomerase family protein [Pantoea]|uniref:Tautomerase family protein n=1 Tax=Candidatus Pantoea multigeneris TaxID=2608357 RepID=A0ABX0R9W6_9GAMM|nr:MULTISPECIES: tautomerase family protein [Pantoea]NIF22156.1 tautomerase family protein [Pantoea multigeneris]
MPEVVVHMASGRTREQKEQLMQKLYLAVKESLSVADEYIVVSLVETPKENKSRGGVPFTAL